MGLFVGDVMRIMRMRGQAKRFVYGALMVKLFPLKFIIAKV